jgi:hypothetical protein
MGPISVFSPSACYKQTDGLRIRPVPEMQMCFVYTPTNPRLYSLNTTAWLVLAMCDGRPGQSLVDAYAELLAPEMSRAQALTEVGGAIDDLFQKGIVRQQQDQPGTQQKWNPSGRA